MIDKQKFKINKINGKNYNYLKCPHCMEHTLEYKAGQNPETEKLFKLSECTSNNKHCPYKQNIPPEKIDKQYGTPPKETKIDQLKKLRWKNIISTIIFILTMTIIITQLL